MSWIELVAERRTKQLPPGVQPPEGAADWFRIEDSADDVDSTDVFIYGSIGGFWGIYADEFIEELNQVTTPNINIRLNSGGGSVFEGIAVSNSIRAHPAFVTVYVDSLAASIASIIMLSGDKIVFRQQAQCMIHNSSGSCYGDSAEMLKMADLLERQNKIIAGAYAERTGRPVDEFLALMAEETWFTGQEAVDIGLADEIYVPPKKEAPLAPAASMMNRAWDLSMFRYAGRENAPEPAAAQVPGTKPVPIPPPVVEPAAVAGQVITADMLTPTGDLVAMLRKAVHDELAEIFDTVAPAHSTAVESGTWDAGANEKRLPSPVPITTAKKMYTWWDATEVADGAVPKSAAKLPHHFVSADGTPGAASVNGVRNALARLPQTQGLSDAERSAAEAHLRKHLNAFSGDEEDSTSTDLHAHVMPKFAIGSRVKITVPPHEEGQDTGVVAEINDGPAYGIRFDGGEHEGSDVHHWYVEDEVEAADSDSKPTPPAEEPAHDSWAGLFAHLITPPSSADDVLKRLREAS